MFSIVGFLVCWIFEIVGYQIKTERVFSLLGILPNLRRGCLQSKKNFKLIFMTRNGPIIVKLVVNPLLTF
jgi:hypothetical protein